MAADSAARVQFYIWFFETVCGNEVGFHFCGRVNTNSNRYWSSESPRLMHEVDPHDIIT
jgi:hypothetical protein